MPARVLFPESRRVAPTAVASLSTYNSGYLELNPSYMQFYMPASATNFIYGIRSYTKDQIKGRHVPCPANRLPQATSSVLVLAQKRGPRTVYAPTTAFITHRIRFTGE